MTRDRTALLILAITVNQDINLSNGAVQPWLPLSIPSLFIPTDTEYLHFVTFS